MKHFLLYVVFFIADPAAQHSCIKTFAFFDLESTGLLSPKKRVNITEMALVCVDRENLQNVTMNGLPRVMHKLRIPIKPTISVENGARFFTGESSFSCQYAKNNIEDRKT